MKPEKTHPPQDVCSYYSCEKRTGLYTCKHCGKKFCSEHLIPKRVTGSFPIEASAAKDWRRKDGHPCSYYTAHLEQSQRYYSPHTKHFERRKRTNMKENLAIVVAILVLVALVSYGVYASRDYISGSSQTSPSQTKYVYWNGATIIGGDGHTITLHDNSNAKNPTWSELLSFLQTDTTDQIPYSYGSFVCADYAETLYNNAEKAGIRAAYVCMELSSGSHSANAFMTTDRGLVFIDDTGQTDSSGYDKQVIIVVGGQYAPTALFSSVQFLSIGTVDSYEITW